MCYRECSLRVKRLCVGLMLNGRCFLELWVSSPVSSLTFCPTTCALAGARFRGLFLPSGQSLFSLLSLSVLRTTLSSCWIDLLIPASFSSPLLVLLGCLCRLREVCCPWFLGSHCVEYLLPSSHFSLFPFAGEGRSWGLRPVGSCLF